MNLPKCVLYIVAVLAVVVTHRSVTGETRGSTQSDAPKSATKKIVLIAGENSHADRMHQHKEGVLLFKHCLDSASNVTGVTTHVLLADWPKDDSFFDDAAAIVVYCDGWEKHVLAAPERWETIRRLMAKGVGLAVIHFALAPPAGCETDYLEWIGGYYEKGYTEDPVSGTEVFPESPDHPICRGWDTFAAYDEFYYRIRFRDGDERVTPIMTAMLPKDKPKLEVLAWAVERKDGGRGFGFTGGHFHSNWSLAPFRKMMLNAILWTAKVEVPETGVRSTVE